MKIFIAGATGRVAHFLIAELLSAGHEITAGVRNPDKFETTNPSINVQKMDLHASVPELAKLLQNQDAVYFVAGSRGQDLLQIDAFGAVKLMQAAEQVGIGRFILLSSIFATEPEKWTDSNLQAITNYNIAKFFADHWLISQTNLDYTIVQPGNLVEAESGSGKIELNVGTSQPNTIPNVASVLAQVLERKNTFKKILQMSDGQTPIEEALNQV